MDFKHQATVGSSENYDSTNWCDDLQFLWIFVSVEYDRISIIRFGCEQVIEYLLFGIYTVWLWRNSKNTVGTINYNKIRQV